jgi:hypothetical protein
LFVRSLGVKLGTCIAYTKIDIPKYDVEMKGKQEKDDGNSDYCSCGAGKKNGASG